MKVSFKEFATENTERTEIFNANFAKRRMTRIYFYQQILDADSRRQTQIDAF